MEITKETIITLVLIIAVSQVIQKFLFSKINLEKKEKDDHPDNDSKPNDTDEP